MRHAFEQYSLLWSDVIVNNLLHTTQFRSDWLPSMACASCVQTASKRVSGRMQSRAAPLKGSSRSVMLASIRFPLPPLDRGFLLEKARMKGLKSPVRSAFFQALRAICIILIAHVQSSRY